MKSCVLLFAFSAVVASAQTLPPTVDGSRILDIRRLLDVCPANDPSIAIIRADLEIRRNGQPTASPACTEPVSDMPVAQITDELVWQQVFRVAYYLDRGRSNYLPWTPLRFYDWVKSKIGGVNIADLGGSAAGSCCVTFAGKLFIQSGLADDLNKRLGVRPQGALSKMALLLGHEVRHVDGFPHVSCCPTGSCDQTYDETNLGPFGIGMYLARALFITDTIPTGLECEYAGVALNARDQLFTTYSTSGNLFCSAKPPTVAAPATPDFAKCAARTLTLATGAVTNAANYANAAIVNGELLTVFSSSIDATQITGAKLGPDGRVTTKLDDTKFLVNAIETPLVYVAPGQLSGIVPFNLSNVRIENNQVILPVEFSRKGLLSQPQYVRLASVNPGIFTADGSGSGPVAALNEDNSVNTAANPAGKGTIVQFFATGTGAYVGIQNSANDGRIMSSNIPDLFYKAAITVDGQQAEILYSGQAPGAVAGVSQINARIPAGLTRTGALPVRITMTTQAGVTAGVMQAGAPTVFVK